MKNQIKDYYIVAVSGGPDSMALFDMARRHGLNLICAHVNYHKRASAYRDEVIVATYCKKYQIPFYKLDAGEGHGNFQAFARDLRYDFFKEIGLKYQTNHVLVAHQLDDYIETLLIQKDRGSIPFYYGIKNPMELKGLELHRPLLTYTKEDLTNYCLEHHIPFGIDESNLSDDYLRNRYRHQIVEKMSKAEKLALYHKIEALNQKRAQLIAQYRKKFTKEIYNVEEIENITDLNLFLRIKLYEDLSEAHLEELKRLIFTTEHFKVQIRNRFVCKEYGVIAFFDEPQDYEYVLMRPALAKAEHFKIVENADSFNSLTLSPDDFPLTIRNYHQGDKIRMVYGTKKLSRFFIDQKILSSKRQTWPVVLNRHGEIIFVPKIGCCKTHYSIKPNFFMIEL